MSMRFRPAALAATLALALTAPAAADAQGMLGKLRKQVEDAVAGPAGGGSAGGLPRGFASPEFELSAARLDRILAAAEKARATARAQQARLEREEAADEQRAAGAARDRRRVSEANRPYAECLTKAMFELHGMKLGQNGPETDPTRARLLSLSQRIQGVGIEVARKLDAGQPVDTAAYVRRQFALTDTTLAVMGAKCPPRPATFVANEPDEDDEEQPSASQDMPSWWVDTDALFLREAGLTERQWGVMRDKLVAFFESAERGVEPAGFAPGELAALRGARARLAAHQDQLTGSGSW